MKPTIYLVCFDNSTEEERVLSKALCDFSDQITIIVWDPSKTEEPPKNKMTLATVVFGYVAGYYLKHNKGREDYFFLPLVARARENEELKQHSLETLNQLEAFVELTLTRMPSSLIEIPEVQKVLSKYKGEELLALLEVDNTVTLKLHTNNDDVINIGKGKEADLSLEELVTLRLATELFSVKSIEIERKKDNAITKTTHQEEETTTRATSQTEGTDSTTESQSKSESSFHLDRIRRGAASKRTVSQ